MLHLHCFQMNNVMWLICKGNESECNLAQTAHFSLFTTATTQSRGTERAKVTVWVTQVSCLDQEDFRIKQGIVCVEQIRAVTKDNLSTQHTHKESLLEASTISLMFLWNGKGMRKDRSLTLLSHTCLPQVRLLPAVLYLKSLEFSFLFLLYSWEMT